MKKYIISVLVENYSGVLSKISGLFSRRGYNIESLTVGVTEDNNLSRMTICLLGDEKSLEQIIKQLNKLIFVIKVKKVEEKECVFREILLIKVHATINNRTYILQNVDVFRANVVDMDSESMTIEITGDEGKIEAFINLMRPYGIKEIVRTGLCAIERGNRTI
ncbi:acetolactate synthase small subunit [Clostridium sp. DL1XJH146]